MDLKNNELGYNKPNNNQNCDNSEIKESIEEISSQLEQKANKNETLNLQSQINNLILEGNGNQNLEVIQSRGNYPVLNERIKKIEANSILDMPTIVLNMASIINNKTYAISGGSWKIIDSDEYYLIAFCVSDLFEKGIVSVSIDNLALEVDTNYPYIAKCDDLTNYTNLITTRYENNGLVTSSNVNNKAYILFKIKNGETPQLTVSSINDNYNYLNNNMSKNIFKKGSNLYDKDCKSNLGQNGSTLSINNSRISTNLIKIENGNSIYFNKSLASGQRDLVLIDKNFNYIKRLNVAMSSDGYYYMTNDTGDVVYIFINCVSDYWVGDDFIVSYNKLTPSELEMSNAQYWVLNELDEKKYWYTNKRLSAMGTSLTAKGSGSQYLTYLKNYFGFANIENCGLGGSRVSGGESNGTSFWTDTRVNALDLLSNIIIIEGGTNDAGKNLNLLESEINLENHDTNTLAGAFNVLLSKIFYKFLKVDGYYLDIDYSNITQVETIPNDFMILIINSPQTFPKKSTWEDERKMVDYIKKVSSMWGIPYCDVFSNMQLNYITYKIDNDGYDSVHFKNFHKKMAEIIIGKLKEIEPLD